MAALDIAARVRTHLREPLNSTAWSLALNTVVTAGLGVGYWAIAANRFDPVTVGRDGALIAAMTTLAVICDLNLNNAAQRFLPQVRERLGRRVAQAYGVVATCSLLGGTLFLLVAPALSNEYEFLRTERALSIAFPLAVALWALFVLQDSVLIALGRAPLVPVENAIFSIAKIAALPLMAVIATANGVFFSWALPTAIVLPAIAALIVRRIIPSARIAQQDAPGVVEVFGRAPLIRFLGQDFVGTVATQVTVAAMPLMVLALVGPRESAFFYIPFALTMAFDSLFVGVATSLTTETARANHRVRENTRLAMRRYYAIQLPGALVIVLFAPLLLMPFGADYSNSGGAVLRILALASVFRAPLLFYGATCRIQGHGGRLLVVQVANALLAIALVAALAPEHGINGAAAAWLVATATVALAALPAVVRYLRNPRIPARSPIASTAGVAGHD